MTDDILKEFIYKVLCKKTITQSLIIALISFTLFLYSVLEKNSFMTGVYLVNSLICISVCILSPILTLKSLKKESLDKGFKDEIIVTFDEEAIRIKEGSYKINIEYDSIIKYYVLDKSTVFMLSQNNGIIISNDGFVRGSLDNCIELINKNKI